ncbi:MAG: hypothetical protein IJM82_08680, partial [Synergistaceae bacterium]|nr:hypothetical protein [Synergistaceae bacterium]
LISKAQFIILGVIGVAMGMVSFFAFTKIFATLAIVLGLITSYKRQTLLGFLSAILGVAAITI